MYSIGEKIKKAREAKNLTQEFVATKLGITQRAYSKIENNEVNITVAKLLEISKILSVEPNEFLPNDGSHTYNNIVSTQKGNGFVINQAEKALELYEKLIIEKDNLIKTKDEIIASLKKQIELLEAMQNKGK